MGPASVLGALEVRQPVGVVTCITSYNNPWANAAGKVAPALAMGNTVVVKPAPQDPLSVFAMASALAEAGVPRGPMREGIASIESAACMLRAGYRQMIGDLAGAEPPSRRAAALEASGIPRWRAG